jgi:hypothetical protein
MPSAVHIKLNVVVHGKSHRFSLLLTKLFVFIHYSVGLTTSYSFMSGEDHQTSNVAGDISVAGIGSATRAGSEAASTTSLTMTNQTMERKEIPLLYQYWKVPTMTNEDITAYHDVGWLSGVLVCTPLPWIFQ